MYKITVMPFIKMLNFQSAFIASSWIKNKMRKIFQKFMIFVESKNYNARGLIVKYVCFVLISILKFYLPLGSSLSDKPSHIYLDFNHIVLIIMPYHIETFFLKAFYIQYQNDV